MGIILNTGSKRKFFNKKTKKTNIIQNTILRQEWVIILSSIPLLKEESRCLRHTQVRILLETQISSKPYKAVYVPSLQQWLSVSFARIFPPPNSFTFFISRPWKKTVSFSFLWLWYNNENDMIRENKWAKPEISLLRETVFPYFKWKKWIKDANCVYDKISTR